MRPGLFLDRIENNPRTRGMAKRACFFPTWTKTVHGMSEGDGLVRVSCSLCQRWENVDLAALSKRVSASYSLINRRCRCRLTKDCKGWNRFFYSHGVMRPLWTEEQAARWVIRDYDRQG